MTEQRHNDRRWTSDYYIVFDRETGDAIGRVLNFSVAGLLLMSAEEIEVPARLLCRMVLPREVDGRTVIIFDAESRWARHNDKSDWYETGLAIISMSVEDRNTFESLEKQSPGNETKQSDTSAG
jgi:hypothetical protein